MLDYFQCARRTHIFHRIVGCASAVASPWTPWTTQGWSVGDTLANRTSMNRQATSAIYVGEFTAQMQPLHVIGVVFALSPYFSCVVVVFRILIVLL